LTEEVLKFIREQKQEQPFFLYYALNVPHTNNEGGRFSERPEKGMEVPDFGPYAGKDWPAPEKGFAAMMRNIDRDVGRILDELKAAGLNRNTLVMFTSDNGPHQEGGHKMDFFDSNGPLRGMKRDLYEGGIRVPLIAWWPGTIQAGKVNHHISGFQDMLPTFAKLSGAPLTSAIDGISMVPTLKGQGIQSEHDFLYWEFSEQKGKRAVLKGDWKLLQLDVATANPSPLQLYNVSQDIAEETDLATQHPDIVAELSQLLDAAHTRNDQYPLFLSEKAVEQGQ
jgi:arylsulfatase A-like enzyme